MRNRLKRTLGLPLDREGRIFRLRPAIVRKFLFTMFGVIGVFLFWGVRANPQEVRDGDPDDGVDAVSLRSFIAQQVGGLDKLKVPATNAEIPLPRQPDGAVNPRFQTTEAKRYLGKLLFHDPVRSARIDINTG